MLQSIQELLCRGSGAGPDWQGKHAVQVHSTNTKITDAEVVEKRTPVLATDFSRHRWLRRVL